MKITKNGKIKYEVGDHIFTKTGKWGTISCIFKDIDLESTKQFRVEFGTGTLNSTIVQLTNKEIHHKKSVVDIMKHR